MELTKFESLVYSRRYEDASRELLAILDEMVSVIEISPAPEGDVDIPVVPSYTRLAAAIVALLADPNFDLSPEGFEYLALRHSQLHSIFHASAFGTADHLLEIVAERVESDPGQRRFSTPAAVRKLLLACSLDSADIWETNTILTANLKTSVPVYLSMLSALCVVTPQAHRRREQLLQLASSFGNVALSEGMLVMAARAWMNVSYAHDHRKHEFKRWLNSQFESLLAPTAAKLSVVPSPRAKVGRPVLAVVVEVFTSTHSMHRCYASWVRELRSYFELVVIGRTEFLDDRAARLFDRVEKFGQADSVSSLAQKIRSLDPAIVYYPSVGMAEWCILLANLRLAPIQIASQGHPASTFSRQIDYFLVSEDFSGDASCYTEKLILTPKGSMRFDGRPDAKPVPPVIESKPEVLRIAVPAMICKISAPFLEICRRLITRSRRPLEFHFFPQMKSVYFHEARQQIKRAVAPVVVHPPQPYNEYIRRLGQCHLHLSPFPFGGMNSNIDSLRQGLPLVTLEGLEPHACMDSWMIRLAGLPESLIAHSEAEYEEAALALITDDVLRVAYSEQLIATDLNAIFFRDPSGTATTPVGDIVWWIYQNHEKIAAHPRRVWRGTESFD